MRTEIRTTCTRDCPDTCGVIATVEDGRIIEHRGDPAHGVTRGVLCARGNHYLERFYDPDRLLHPQRRTARGWERIGWDEALDLVADKLRHYRATLGPRSVLALTYSGVHTWLPRVMWRLFWGHFGGATFSRGGLSVEPAHAAQELDFGGDCTHEPEDLVQSRGFVIWGKNLAVTRQHWLPFVKQARQRGAPLWVIDPVRTGTAKLADRFLQLRPGSDGLLALGVARLLLERGAVDWDFLAKHTSGLEAFRELVMAHDLQSVARATDLDAGQIRELADLYAQVRPLATFVGLGPSYWEHGTAQVRLIDALVALTGNVGVSGGGASTDLGRSPGLDLSMMSSAPRGETRTVLLPRLGAELQSATDPPVAMGWIAGANPASTAPETARVRDGLRSLEFLVVVDQFMTATAEHAHLVLPCTTYLEADDLATAYGHAWLGLTRQVVPPLGEARPDAEIYQLLAQRLGFGEALAGDPETWLRRLLAPLAAEGVTLERLREGSCRNPHVAPFPFANRVFKTPSGKLELITAFAPPPPPAADTLRLVATKTLRMVNSQILPGDLPEEPVVRLHPDTLAARRLRAGDQAWLASRVGRVRVRLEADATVRRDVVLLNPALWRGDSSGVNQLREARLSDGGDGAALHETLVTLERS